MILPTKGGQAIVQSITGRYGALHTRKVAAQRGGGKNRGRLDIVAEVINACNNGANKSRIMLAANINSVMATELVNKLVYSGLLVPKKEGGNTIVYYPTQEGEQFVRGYSILISMLCSGLVPPSKISDSKAVEAWT